MCPLHVVIPLSAGGYETHPEPTISILAFLFLRMRTDLFTQSKKMGTMYMLYEIGEWGEEEEWAPRSLT